MAHHGAALRKISKDEGLASRIDEEGSEAGLPPRLSAILRYAEKLSRRPAEMTRDDVAGLRNAGLDDRAVLEVAEITAYFNFVNRLADGLGVILEDYDESP